VPGARLKSYCLESRQGTGVHVTRRNARIQQRQLNVLLRTGTRQEMETLKHKTDFRIADLGQTIARQLGDVYPFQEVMATAGAIETSQDIHKGGLAGA
jgi:hypothetical protein